MSIYKTQGDVGCKATGRCPPTPGRTIAHPDEGWLPIPSSPCSRRSSFCATNPTLPPREFPEVSVGPNLRNVKVFPAGGSAISRVSTPPNSLVSCAFASGASLATSRSRIKLLNNIGHWNLPLQWGMKLVLILFWIIFNILIQSYNLSNSREQL